MLFKIITDNAVYRNMTDLMVVGQMLKISSVLFIDLFNMCIYSCLYLF